MAVKVHVKVLFILKTGNMDVGSDGILPQHYEASLPGRWRQQGP